jgi:hypothetical protein
MTMSEESTPSGIPIGRSCPICGAAFTCMNSPSCWCASRTLTDRLRRHLAERYTGCLCPECLDRLIREDATETEKNGG